MHAMQSGVAMEHIAGSQDGTPKHLRTGVNSALVDSAAVCRLLIEKHVFTRDELENSLADEAEREVERYERRLETRLGHSVTLR